MSREKSSEEKARALLGPRGPDRGATRFAPVVRYDTHGGLGR